MTRESWRTLALTTLACLAPIALGTALWGRLPNPMPIHFGVDDQPNGWAPKPVALLALPALMAALNAWCVWTSERKFSHGVPRPTWYALLYWSIPFMCVTVYLVMIAYALEGAFSVGKAALAIMGVIFLVAGNYSPKMSHATAQAIHHPTPRDERTWRRWVRVEAYVLVALGVAALVAAVLV